MILIVTHKNDFTVDFVIEKLNNRQIAYYRLNCEDIDEKGYTLKFGKNEDLQINKLKDISSVWFRRTKLPEVKISSESNRLFVLNDYDVFLSNLFSIIPSDKWMSKPHDINLAENKLYQLKKASQLGFTIPDSIITSRKEDLLTFAQKHNYQIIIKPISQGRIIEDNSFENIFTNVVRKEHFESIEKYDLTPCIFQECIEKKYEIRVTIVNGILFSAKVESQLNDKTKIDWRKEKLEFKKYELPKNISDKCLSLLEELNLNFGAIDLIKTMRDEYVFLEINPNGQWAWIEFDTGLPISDEIINFLQ
tara:strand:+ start:1362 stop:2279 length:918 start_codon:yes stop_codon:yes gene_type:complete